MFMEPSVGAPRAPPASASSADRATAAEAPAHPPHCATASPRWEDKPEHRFYGLAPGEPPHLRETGRFFIHWMLEDGGWKMSRAYSYDHRPAE